MASYQKEDSPPPRVRPLPVRGTQTLDIESQGTASRNITISNLTWFSFFFLLRPSKYYKGGTNTAQGTTVRNIAISDLNSVAFFFLLRLGKYCKGSTETVQHPFRIKDVQLFIGQQPHNSATASNSVLAQADFVSLLFTTQKNGVKGG